MWTFLGQRVLKNKEPQASRTAPLVVAQSMAKFGIWGTAVVTPRASTSGYLFSRLSGVISLTSKTPPFI